jgi:hypothetical protein
VRSVLAQWPEEVPIWLAVDATPEERPEAETSKDRGSIPISQRPVADKPIRSG